MKVPKPRRRALTAKMGRLTTTGSLLASLGFVVLLICSIPMTSADEVISTSFTIASGTKYGPNDSGTSYHTRIFGKSVLKGDVVVQGVGIYLTAGFFNTQHLNSVYVDGQYNFVIDPADDLYVFIFDNTNGKAESLVSFTLKEVWTRPMALGSPPLFILGLIGLVTFLMGLVALFMSHLRTRGLFKWRRPSLKMWATVFTALFLLSNLRSGYFAWPDFDHWSYGFPLFWLTHQLSSFAGPVDRWLFDSASLAVNMVFWVFIAIMLLALKSKFSRHGISTLFL